MCKDLAVPQKFRHKTTLWSSSSVSGYASPKRIESKDWNRYLYTCVHSNIIHSSPKVETTQMFITGWVDKEDVVYTFNKLLFNLKTFIITCLHFRESCSIDDGRNRIVGENCVVGRWGTCPGDSMKGIWLKGTVNWKTVHATFSVGTFRT